MIRNFLTVGGWTMISRILGFLRDILFAAFLGAGPAAEAFVVAFSLPNMFRRFFAEGAFNMAFVPMFAKKLEAGEDATGFAKDAISGLAGILLIFTLVAQLAMPWLILAMASGFRGDERFDLALVYGRIVFAYIIFISLAALVSGVLNSAGKFAAAAAAPVLLNVVLIAAMGAAHWQGWDIGLALAYAVLVAGILQLALVWRAASRAGFSLSLRMPRMTDELKQLAVIAAPAALAGGVIQVNLLVGRQVASFFDGSIQYLNLADRLYQLPLGVVAIAIGVVLLPELARKLRSGDEVGGQSAFNRATEFALVLTVPAAVALVVIPLPLVSVLFERGAFSAADALATAPALAIYGLGLPSFVLQKVLQPLFFARADTKTPFRIAVKGMVVNAVLAVGLAFVFDYLAAAIATSVAGWYMVWLLWRASRDMGASAEIDARLRHRVGRIIAASLAMGAVLAVVAWAINGWLFEPGLRYLALAGLVAIGAVSYIGLAHATGAMTVSDLRGAVRRGR